MAQEPGGPAGFSSRPIQYAGLTAVATGLARVTRGPITRRGAIIARVIMRLATMRPAAITGRAIMRQGLITRRVTTGAGSIFKKSGLHFS